MTAPERRSDAALVEAAMLGPSWRRAERITLVVPWGPRRSFKLDLPLHVAGWLRDQLSDALGGPRRRPRRQPRLRRGQWIRRHQPDDWRLKR